jgi:hypothetical protein
MHTIQGNVRHTLDDFFYCHPPFFPFTHILISPFTYLEIPLFELVVQMLVRSCPWLVVN